MATHNDDYDETAAGVGCGCFRRFCFGRDNEEEGQSYLLREKEASWFDTKLKKLREFSEMVAGPKWKNLIRKIGKVFNPKKHQHHYNTAPQYDQYSPESYALNFAGDDDGDLSHSFSTRFAPGHFVNDHQKTKPVL